MNKRIQELAEQAVVEVKNLSGTEYIFSKEKFAELLVKECADVAADHDALDIYEEIREHFGVTE